MPRKLPRYVQGFIDRNGHLRHYLRKAGMPRTPLPGIPHSREFMAVYYDALLGLAQADIPEARIVMPALTGSFGAALDAYYIEPAKRKAAFVNLAPLTKDVYRRELERLRGLHGAKSLSALKTKHYADMVDARALETVSGAAQLVKALRSFGKYTVKSRTLKANPMLGLDTVDVEPRRLREGDVEEGHLTWTLGEMVQFQRHHKPGTKPRLAFELVLGLGQRRSDAITVGPANLLGGYDPTKLAGKSVRFVQVKNRTRKPVTLVLPLVDDLAAELERHPVAADAPAFLLRDGKPYAARQFNKDFAQWVRDAGINAPLVPHGLRKSAAARLAQTRATPHEIASVTGHRSLREVERYTQGVEQEDMARGAMARIGKKY